MPASNPPTGDEVEAKVPKIHTHSRSWTDSWPRGTEAEALLLGQWRPCAVVASTRSGLPIVRLIGDKSDATFRIDRKGDIRAPKGVPQEKPSRR